MKKFFGSTRRKNAQSIDGGSPANQNKNLQSSDYFNGSNSRHASRTSLNNNTVAKPALTPGSPPLVTPSAVAPSPSTPTGAGGSFADAVGQNVSGGLAIPASPSRGPRPSELFAGKGVQWGQIDLTARDLTKPTDAATTNVDMQKFLKERRQWIPTFKDSETVEEGPAVNLPKQFEQFSFDTSPEVTKSSAGLKDLKALEETHKRKNALLDKAPLTGATNGTIFEEAGPSTSTSVVGASGGGAAAADGKPGQSLPPPPAPPSRNQSFRTSTFAASNDSVSRKSGSLSANGVVAPASASASRDIPQRRSSVRKDLSELDGNASAFKPAPTGAVAAVAATEAATETPATGAEQTDAAVVDAPRPANGRVEQIKEQSGVSEPARPATATGSVRPSMETAGFATSAGSQSHDGEHNPTGDANDADTTATAVLALPTSPAANDATHDSATTVATPTSPPRPPKNDQRTPSRQNSKEPINPSSTPSKVGSLVEKFGQAAPSLQNVVPGTGAATTREA